MVLKFLCCPKRCIFGMFKNDGKLWDIKRINCWGPMGPDNAMKSSCLIPPHFHIIKWERYRGLTSLLDSYVIVFVIFSMHENHAYGIWIFVNWWVHMIRQSKSVLQNRKYKFSSYKTFGIFEKKIRKKESLYEKVAFMT